MGQVSPRLWDDERFVRLSNQSAKLLWLYLLTTTQDVPGLIKGGPPTFAYALRLPEDEVRAALAEITTIDPVTGVAMAEFDEGHQLLRLPNAPRYNPPGNPNVIRGWYRRWCQLPESDLKYRHVPSIREASERFLGDEGSSGQKWRSAWACTFGHNGTREARNQGELFDSRRLKPSPKALVIPFERHEGGLSKDTYTETSPETYTETETETETETANSSAATSPDELADRIWSDQERLKATLRAEGIDPGARPIAASHPGKRELVARIAEVAAEGGLERAEDDCRHVLAVLEDEARRKRTLRWLDGAQWEAKRFATALAMVPGHDSARSPPRVGRYHHTGQERYAGGEVKI